MQKQVNKRSTMYNQVLESYGLQASEFTVQEFGSGLIHHTYLVKNLDKENVYILQEVNTSVFKKPEDIAYNLEIASKFLQQHHKDYYLPIPLHTLKGDAYVQCGEKHFRLTPFVRDSHSINSCETAVQAYEAARQFGKFTAYLNGVRTDMLRYTIPGFHDLTLRWQQFREALQNGHSARITETRELTDYLAGQERIVKTYEEIKRDPGFRLRVIHHDTKINNVLFDRANKGICVIDLDTVMPGYFISDVGDMMRTYLSPADEEVTDFSRISVRNDFFEAIVRGYLEYMAPELSGGEKSKFFYAGEFIIYMQALRFMTDYLNNDRYYGAKYERHNLNRAVNQITLLQRLKEKEGELQNIITKLTVSS